MEKSFVFNSINGDRKYKAEDFREYFASFIGNGVFPNPSTNLQVIANNNMSVTIKSGKGWINGAIYVNTDDYIISISPADGVLNRIDRIVLRMDTVERKIKAVVKKGQFSSSPSAIPLQRDADAYEIALADIRINKGAISITQADIVDIRQNKELCGIVHGTVDQVDVTTLFNQYATKLGLKEIEFEQEFKAWFETVKGQLSGDVAGNLANQIAENKEKIKNVESHLNDKALKSDLGNINDASLDLSLRGKSLTQMAKVLFQNADNAQKGISTVIGSPLSASDTLETQKSKIQMLKNTFASNLTVKEQSSNGAESLQNLINKVGNINVGRKFAKGVFEYPYKLHGLEFQPNLIVLHEELKSGVYRSFAIYLTNILGYFDYIINIYTMSASKNINGAITIFNDGFEFDSHYLSSFPKYAWTAIE